MTITNMYLYMNYIYAVQENNQYFVLTVIIVIPRSIIKRPLFQRLTFYMY